MMFPTSCPATWRRLLLACLFCCGAAIPAFADEVRLTWDANTEPDLAGYVVLYGTTSRVYSQSLEVAPTTPRAVVTNLTAGGTYYFAVRAYNTAGLQSGFSNEVVMRLATASGPTPAIAGVSPASGPAAGGTTVTISGSGFASGIGVRFGATVATVKSTTATSVLAVAPVGAVGTVAVTVANPNGQSATKAGAFTYLTTTAPTITAISPASGPTSGGTSVTLSGSGFASGLTVRFGSRPAVVTSISATRVVAVAPAGTKGAVTVTAISATGQVATAAALYRYVSPPVITDVTPSSGPVDGGTAVTITGRDFLTQAAVHFGTTPGTVTVRKSNLIVVTAPAGIAGAVSITVTNKDGQSATKAGAFTYSVDDAETLPEPTFVRYFVEGAQGQFFATHFALANPHDAAVTVQATFTDTSGRETPMTIDVPAGAHVSVDATNMPALGSDAFASRFESARPIGIERTVVWGGETPYGSHSDVGIEAPRTTWYFADGATHSGFDLFYLLQNPGGEAADVLIRYMLGTGQVIEKMHRIAPRVKTTLWVNHDDPALAGADVSAQLISVNNVPIVAERSMYQSVNDQLFTAGHNSGAIAEPATQWFLADGATGDTVDTFVVISNPNAIEAHLQVTYIRETGAPVDVAYVVAPHSRRTIALDEVRPDREATDLSIAVRSTNGTPVVVERTTWWAEEAGGTWTEAHNSAGATTTSGRWLLSDGLSSTADGAVTIASVINTGTTSATVRVTLLTASGAGRTIDLSADGQTRLSIDVGEMFPEAQDTTFGLLIESPDYAPLVVERASYQNAGTARRTVGTSSLGMPLPTSPAAPHPTR